MTKTYVLDASAVLDFLEGNRGGQRINQLFAEALRPGTTLLMSVVNLGEILYIVWQQSGEDEARKVIASMSGIPVQFIPVDLRQSFQAGELKARHKIPYVDCIAAALAIERRAILVTSDRDFEKLGRRIDVLWLKHP